MSQAKSSKFGAKDTDKRGNQVPSETHSLSPADRQPGRNKDQSFEPATCTRGEARERPDTPAAAGVGELARS